MQQISVSTEYNFIVDSNSGIPPISSCHWEWFCWHAVTLLARVATAGRASLCVRSCLAAPAHPPFARGHGGPRVPLRPFVSCSSCSPSFRVWPRRAAFHFASGRVAQLVLTVLRADCCTAADSHLVLEAGPVATSPVVLPRSVVPSGCACGVPAYASVPAFHVRVFVAALSQRRNLRRHWAKNIFCTNTREEQTP